MDGHACYVLDAVGLTDIRDPQYRAYIRVWLDAERGLRPLRLEKYEWMGDVPEEGRWKAMRQCIDHIQLEQVNGVWIPVEGRQTYFNVKGFQRPDSMSESAFRQLSRTEQLCKGTPILKEAKEYTRHTRIDPQSVKLNQGIPESKFVVQFPQGCRVWDEFAQIGFTVGKTSNPTLEENWREEDSDVFSPAMTGLDEGSNYSLMEGAPTGAGERVTEDSSITTLGQTEPAAGHGTLVICGFVGAIAVLGLLAWYRYRAVKKDVS